MRHPGGHRVMPGEPQHLSEYSKIGNTVMRATLAQKRVRLPIDLTSKCELNNFVQAGPDDYVTVYVGRPGVDEGPVTCLKKHLTDVRLEDIDYYED